MNLQIKLSELQRLINSAKRKSSDLSFDVEDVYFNIHPSGQTFINGHGGSGGFFCQTLLYSLVEEGSGSYPQPTFEITPEDASGNIQRYEREDLELAKKTGDRYRVKIIGNPDYHGKLLMYMIENTYTARTKKQARQLARDLRNEYLDKVECPEAFTKKDYNPEWASEPVYYSVSWNGDIVFSISIKKLPEVI